MRRLVSRQEMEKKRKRNQLIVGVVLIFIMVGSTLGFVFQFGGGNLGNSEDNSGNILNYNGLQFEFINGFWVFGNFVFRYNPEEVPNIGSGLNAISSYRDFPLYFYSENEEAAIEVQVNIGGVAESLQEACPESESGSCEESLPVRTCIDNFIIIKENSISDIRQEENCVYIEGPATELTRLTDQFLYKILGVK